MIFNEKAPMTDLYEFEALVGGDNFVSEIFIRNEILWTTKKK